MKFGIRGQLTDLITCVKFLVDRFRGYGVLTPPKLPFSIDLLRRTYNSVALPCDTVIVSNHAKYLVQTLRPSFTFWKISTANLLILWRHLVATEIRIM